MRHKLAIATIPVYAADKSDLGWFVSGRGDDVPYRQALLQSGQLLGWRLSLSFNITSLFIRMNHKTYYRQHYEQDSTSYSHGHRKLFKEITCKCNSENRLCKIRQKLCQKLLSFFRNRIHDFSITYDRPLSSVIAGLVIRG